ARRGLGRVVEHVAQVRPAARAAHLGADHPVTAVGEELDAVARERAEEARPPAVRVELRVGAEQLVAARATRVDADALLVEQLARPGALGARLPQDGVLLRGQLGAPLLVGLDDVVALVLVDRVGHGPPPTVPTSRTTPVFPARPRGRRRRGRTCRPRRRRAPSDPTSARAGGPAGGARPARRPPRAAAAAPAAAPGPRPRPPRRRPAGWPLVPFPAPAAARPPPGPAPAARCPPGPRCAVVPVPCAAGRPQPWPRPRRDARDPPLDEAVPRFACVCGGVMSAGRTYCATSPTRPLIVASPGATGFGWAVIFALRVRSRTSPRCSGSMTVTTTPSEPARAVRPERCRYALCSAGGSTCTTSSTSSTWMPRAAMSVATSTLTAPEEN